MAFLVFCGFLYLAAVNCESSCWQDPSNGRLDCDGRSGCEVTGMACHSECECRHLDTVEQRRFSTNEFRYPSSPALVITASRDGKRCASTWAFNAVRLLFRQAKEACDSYWLRQVTKEKLDQRVKTGTHVVVKTHEWHGGMEAFEKLKHRFTHVILSVREGFPREETWMSVASHVLHFEKLVAFDTLHPDDESKIGALTVLKDLSEHLGLSLTQRDLKEVDYELMTLQIPQSGCNQTTNGPFMDGVVGGLSPSNLEFSEGLGAEAVHFSGLNMLEMQIIGHAADQSPGHKNRAPELPSIAMSSNVKHV